MSEVIKIKNKNSVHLRVEASPSVLQELSDYFTFDVPNANLIHYIKIKCGMGS